MFTAQNTKTIYDLVQRAGIEYADEIFLRYEKEGAITNKSYRMLAKDCNIISAWMQEQRVNKGTQIHVALLGSSSYYYLALLLGIMSAGDVAVTLDSQLTESDLADCLNRSDSDILLYDWVFHPLLDSFRKNCPSIKQYICIQPEHHALCIEDILTQYQNIPFCPSVSPQDCAIILFTSGTTGEGKGVMLSHENLLDNTFCGGENEPTKHEIYLNVLPIHHMYCLNGDIFIVILYGNTLCLSGNLSKMLYYINLYQPTAIRLVPMMAKALYNKIILTSKQYPTKKPSEIKELVLGKRLYKLVSGGAYLSESLASKFIDLDITIGQGYGLSECSPKITAPDFSRNDKLMSIGKVVERCQVRIINDEIQVKSPSVMMGYYKDPERTAEAITFDGWLRTGDLGYIDDDNFLYLTGRKKNLIILSNGENVSPEEIENHFDSEMLITDIVVYESDDKIVAEIYPNYDYASAQNIDDIYSEIKKIIAKHNKDLSSYKKIIQFSIRNTPFEKTSSKKIIRRNIWTGKDTKMSNEPALQKPQNAVEQELYDRISELIGTKSFGVDTDIFEAGIDSLGCITLIEILYEKFHKKITLSDLIENATILKMEIFLKDKTPENTIDYSIREKYNLSKIQQYFAYVIKGNTTGNMPIAFQLDQHMDLFRLKKALEDLIDIHPELKAIIRFDQTAYKIFRDDDRKIDIPIIQLTQAQWQSTYKDLLIPFAYTADDNMFHISIYQTESAKYLFFDIAHIMGDGVTLNILLEDLNKLYSGETLTKENYTFYEFILDEEQREKLGIREQNIKYYASLMQQLKIKRSILNKPLADYSIGKDAVIQKKFDQISQKDILLFCQRNNVSENAFFLTAFNYCISVFRAEEDIVSASIHSGRTDNRWARIAGPLFLTYFFRVQFDSHESVLEVLHKNGKQIINTMQCHTSTAHADEMFFQYQGDILNFDKIGNFKVTILKLQLDSLPFHMQVMKNQNGYYTELRYWENRFDAKQLELFLTCYQCILEALMQEENIAELNQHFPKQVYPSHLEMTASCINQKVGHTLLKGLAENTKISLYLLNQSRQKIPYGAWGTLYVAEKEPQNAIGLIQNPFDSGVLYQTDIVARILPDDSLDLLDQNGRTVMTEGARGRSFFNLKQVEDALYQYNGITYAEAYTSYSPEYNDMILTADIKGVPENELEHLKSYLKESCSSNLVPLKFNCLN